MSLVKELYKALGEIGSDYKRTNKDTSVVKLLDKAIGTLSTAVSAMDKFLKRKGVDVGKLYNDGVGQGKSLLDKLKTNKAGEKVSLTKGLIERGKDIGSTIKDTYKKFTDSKTAPPDEENSETTTEKEGILSRLKKKFTPDESESKNIFYSTLLDKFNVIAERVKPSDKKDLDGDGIEEEDLYEKRNNRINKRKEEVEAEKKAVAERGKKGDKKGGFLNTLLSKLSSMTGLLTGGIWAATKFLGKGLARVAWWTTKKAGALLWSGLKWLGPKIISGVGSVFGKLIPNLSGGIARTLQTVIGRGGFSLAKGALLTAGRAALPVLGTAAGIVGKAALAALVSPIGLAAGAVIAVGAAAYGGYKLYKYITRNNIAEDIYGKLTLLRLQTYGYGNNAKEHYSKLFDLEMLLKDNLKFSAQEKKLTIDKPNEEQSEKIFDIFDIGPDEKEKRAALGTWFVKRFLPSYHAFMQALYSVNTSIFLDDLEKLNANNIKELMLYYKLPTDALSHTLIPFFREPETTVTKTDIETTIASINAENNSNLRREDKTPEERMAGEIAKKILEDKSKDITRKALQKANLPVKPKQQTNTEGPVGVMKLEPDAEEKPKEGTALLMATNKANSAIPKAEGPLTKFDGTLVGIRTKLSKESILNLDPDMLNLFAGMAKEYNALTGKELNVNEAFRSYEQQAALYKKYGPSGKAAPPGRSLHEFGLAIDINSEDTRQLEKLGLLRKYGFTVPVGGEPWHLEPIGVSLDPNKAKKDKAYRKDAILTSVGKGGGGYGLLPNSAKYRRDIALQQSIYGSKINETSPEEPKENTTALVANTEPTVKTSTLKDEVNKKNETTPTPAYTGTGAVNMSELLKGNIVAQEPEPKVKTSTTETTDLSSIGSSYASSVTGVGTNLSLTNKANLTPIQAIQQASKMTGVSEETLMTFGKLESSLRSNVSAGTSTAGGLFQFTDSTWEEQLRINGPKYGLSPDTPKTDPLANALMAAEYAKANLRNVSGYEQAGLSQEVALYLTHHFGPTGGKNLIDAYKRNPNAPVQTAVNSKAYDSNKAALQGKTIAGYFQSLDNKFAVAKATPASAYKGSGATEIASVSASKPSIVNTPSYTPVAEENTANSMYASYTPTQVSKPTLNAGAYDITRVDAPITSPRQEQLPNVTINTDNLETIMNSQLGTLTQIVSVLSMINDKLDLEKLVGIVGSASGKEKSPSGGYSPSIRQTPSMGVNMGKKLEV